MFPTRGVEKIKNIYIYIPRTKTSFFLSENRSRYWVLWKKGDTARQVTDGNIIRRMRVASWIPKATNTYLECVILIAFTQQQWLHERASTLRYTCTSCLVVTEIQTVYCAVRT